MRPHSREVPRCEQCGSSAPTRPFLSRETTSSSQSSFTFFGKSSSSSEVQTGCQYRRKSSPIGLPGSTAGQLIVGCRCLSVGRSHYSLRWLSSPCGRGVEEWADLTQLV